VIGLSLSGKRLVVFGCGYVGSAVARAAIAEGARVDALTRNAEKAAVLRSEGLKNVVVADLASTDWHEEIERGADFVVNCVSSGGGGSEGYRRSYVDGMESILAWAEQGDVPVGTMVYTSSTSVYAQGEGAVVDESCAAKGGTPNGAIIRESEQLLEASIIAECRRWFILRLAGIYGPGRHHLLDQLRDGAPTLNGTGDHHLNLVHRDDIVSAVMACLHAGETVDSGIYNVADSGPARRGEVVRWLAEQLGRDAPEFDGSTTARRNGAPMPDRIIIARKLRATLGWKPTYPDYRAGFAKLLSR
jgi:nucleoside-diphosphate-sugar epimerase